MILVVARLVSDGSAPTARTGVVRPIPVVSATTERATVVGTVYETALVPITVKVTETAPTAVVVEVVEKMNQFFGLEGVNLMEVGETVKFVLPVVKTGVIVISDQGGTEVVSKYSGAVCEVPVVS
jgi:hypothetical protein